MKKLIYFTLPSILSRLISFFVFPIITFYISPEDYGILSISIVICTIITTLVTLSVNNYIFKSLKEQSSSNGTDDLKESYSITFCISSIIFGALIINGFLFENSKLVLLTSFLLIVYFVDFFFCSFYRDFYRATNNARDYAVADLIKVILYPSFTIMALVQLGWGVYSVVLGNVAALVMTIIYNTRKSGVFFHKVSFSKKLKTNLLSVYKYTVPFAIFAILQLVLTGGDRVIISYLLSSHEAGIYATAVTIASILGLVANAVNNQMIGVFMNTTDPEKVQSAIELYSKFIFFVCFSIYLMSKPFIELFLHDSYVDSIPYVPFLLAGQLLYSLHLVSVNVMGIIALKSKLIPVSTLIATIFSVSMNFILIPKFGLYIATIVSLASFVVLLVISYSLSRRYFRYRLFSKRLLYYCVIMLIFITISELTVSLSDSSIVLFIINIAIILIALIVFILLEKKEVVKYFYKRKVKVEAAKLTS
ncbi:lipopolysaccharide biosynthesis protein [Paenibacillus sp. YYML68]|uniref:lipopolysaccharide biosynthesis protein n=1 Tax=Paenibacillus sp. YYML68 TaxID=2909250 RepID=UPI00249091EC|nr:oligosaccharide flippase family protein [Paenibacillus sp. YYML68]